MATVTTEIVKASSKATTATFTYAYVETAAKEFRRISIGDFMTATDIVTKSGTQTITGVKTIYVGTATSNSDWLKFVPTDYATGKPGLFLKKTATASIWQYYLWDGTSNAGSFDFAMDYISVNSSPIPAKIVETIVTATGAGTWTKPANLVALEVIAIGAGGGGGGVDGTGVGAGNGTGGGGGGFVYKRYAAADLSASEAYSVGAGGAGGVASAAPSAGGNTTFKGLTASGGAAGTSMNATNYASTLGSAGGAASGGDVNIPGGASDASIIVNSYACSASNGGATLKGFGGRGAVGTANGNAGTGYGAGGGGAAVSSSSSNNYDGGAGANGLLIFREYRWS